MAQHYEKASQKLSFKQILWNNFIAGISWTFGATIGLSIIFALLSILAKKCRLYSSYWFIYFRCHRFCPQK